MALTTFKSVGIQYSTDFFTEDTIALMLEPPAKAPPAELVAAPAPTSLEAAVSAAWALLGDDANVQKAIKEKKLTEGQAKAQLTTGIAAPLAATADATLDAALKVEYQTRVENGDFVHLLNGERILTIPGSVKSAPMVSANADAIMYGCFLVIDVLSIIAAAASVSVAVQKTKLAKVLQGPLGGFFKRLMNPATVRELKALEKLGKKLDLIQRVLVLLHGSTNIKTVVGAFLHSLSWLDYSIAIVQLVASVLLLIGTAGASLAAKILQLAGAVAMFIADLVGFIKALGEK